MSTAYSRGRCLINIEVTPETRDALHVVARREDLNLSQLIRRAIRQILTENEAAPAANRGGFDDARAGAICDPI